VVFDEVFTGLYRLGRFNCSSFLQAHPDIIVNAKLLTGGLVPLCTTTASQSVFDAFLSEEKSAALLHGHSYTAHAVGCGVAVESLETLMKMACGVAWDGFRESWDLGADAENPSPSPSSSEFVAGDKAWSMWSQPFVKAVSRKESVEHVIALGSVLAVALKDESGTGELFGCPDSGSTSH
jgi:dethiobiotin synthetase/adenosylmethionine--8-amino-7-oxononanoate aminotransferase